MTRSLKGVIKGLLRRAGYTLTPLSHYDFFPPPEDRYRWLERMGIRSVLDVGAHTGESAVQFHALFPEATVYSFEPLRDCFRQLELAVGGKPRQLCFNLALGDKPGSGTINRNAFSASSSLLKIGDLHKRAYPFTAEETAETIEIDTLDGVAARIELEPEVLLKIDTQGFEKNVLQGGAQLLARVKVLIVETSFVELYQGQARFPEIYRLLEDKGFEYRGSWDQFHNPKDGTPLQQDSIFMRADQGGT